jgi:hypothetical protein
VDGVRVVRLGVDLDLEEEVWRNEDGLEGQLQAGVEAVAVSAGQLDEAKQAVQFVAADRAAVGAAGERLEDLPHGLRVVLVRREGEEALAELGAMEGLGDDLLGGGQVLLRQKRRQRQDVADVVEA